MYGPHGTLLWALGGLLWPEIQIIPTKGNHGFVPSWNCWIYELSYCRATGNEMPAHPEHFDIINFALKELPRFCDDIENITVLLPYSDRSSPRGSAGGDPGRETPGTWTRCSSGSTVSFATFGVPSTSTASCSTPQLR
jgi:hypothetical protein